MSEKWSYEDWRDDSILPNVGILVEVASMVYIFLHHGDNIVTL
jgi:hypothetical protein